MSISLNTLLYGDGTTDVLEKGCAFCSEKHQVVWLIPSSPNNAKSLTAQK